MRRNLTAVEGCGWRVGRCWRLSPSAAERRPLAIEDVAAGDVVLATDPITGVTSPEPVTDLIRHLEDHAWVSVTVVSETGSEILEATEEHPFFVTSAPTAFYPGQVKIAGGWVNAADLAVGDVVRTADGGSALVAGVTVAPVTTDTLDWAFNLTVANAHTYYVGEQPVLVRNTGAACPYEAGKTVRQVAQARGANARVVNSLPSHILDCKACTVWAERTTTYRDSWKQVKKILDQSARLNQKTRGMRR